MRRLLFFFGIVLVSLTACGTSPEELTIQTKEVATAAAANWAKTPTLTLTSTFTTTPTYTPTITLTLTPTPFAGNPELFFSERETNNPGEIYSLNLITGKKVLIFNPRDHDLRGIKSVNQISLSPRGNYLAFKLTYHNNDQQAIFLNRASGEIMQLFSSKTTGFNENQDFNFLWRADEEYILFRVKTEKINLTQSSFIYNVISFQFSPDSGSIERTALSEEEINLIYSQIYGRNGIHCERNTLEPNCSFSIEIGNKVTRYQLPYVTKDILFNPDLSPDKRNVAFVLLELEQNEEGRIYSTAHQIYFFDLETEEFHKVSPDDGFADGIDWSTDGKHIFYSYKAPGSQERKLFMFSIDSSETIELLKNYWAYGVKEDGFPSDINLGVYVEPTETATLAAVIKPGTNCIILGEMFSAEENDLLPEHLDIVGGYSEKKSDNLITVSITLRDLPENFANSNPDQPAYRIRIRNIFNQFETFVEVKKDLNGKLFATYKIQTGDFSWTQSNAFLVIDEIKNTITVSFMFPRDQVFPDNGILRIFTSSPLGKDSLNCIERE